jgi:hypothetical protein
MTFFPLSMELMEDRSCDRQLLTCEPMSLLSGPLTFIHRLLVIGRKSVLELSR